MQQIDRTIAVSSILFLLDGLFQSIVRDRLHTKVLTYSTPDFGTQDSAKTAYRPTTTFVSLISSPLLSSPLPLPLVRCFNSKPLLYSYHNHNHVPTP